MQLAAIRNIPNQNYCDGRFKQTNHRLCFARRAITCTKLCPGSNATL